MYVALHPLQDHPLRGIICVLSLNPDQSSWYVLDAPTVDFALATYHSQLVLVGGKEDQTDHRHIKVTNKLWVSGDGGRNWRCSLPPMPTKRCSTLAVNSRGSPECLIVAGGTEGNGIASRQVEVFREGYWSTAQSLPKFHTVTKSTIHQGHLYLTDRILGNALWCKLSSLLTSVPGATKEEIWRECEIPFNNSCLASFGGHLLVIHSYEQPTPSGILEMNMIHAYYQSWVRVQELPFSASVLASESLPSSRELLMVFFYDDARWMATWGIRASLKGKVALVYSV